MFLSSSNQVQRSGLFALGNICYGSKRNTAALGTLRAWEPVLKAMTAFPHSEGVQENGALALANMAFSNAANKEAMGTMDLLNALLSAMAGFPRSEGIPPPSLSLSLLFPLDFAVS